MKFTVFDSDLLIDKSATFKPINPSITRFDKLSFTRGGKNRLKYRG